MKFSFKTKSLMAAMSFASLALVTGTSTAATAVQKLMQVYLIIKKPAALQEICLVLVQIHWQI